MSVAANNIAAEASGAPGAAASYSASAADIVDGAVAASCSPASGSIFPLGATTVTCSATDAHGNSSTKTFTVTVVDTTPPGSTAPTNIVKEAAGPGRAAASDERGREQHCRRSVRRAWRGGELQRLGCGHRRWRGGRHLQPRVRLDLPAWPDHGDLQRHRRARELVDQDVHGDGRGHD